MSEKHTPDFEPRIDQDPRFDKATVEALKGPAALREVWEAGSKDQVEVTGYLGTYDGKQFMEVSYGPDNQAPVPLEELRFSHDRERELKDAGVDLEALLKPDPTDYEQSPHEYERVYHRVSREQKKQIVRAAYDEAGGLMARAEELYREAELANVRADIEQSRKYGAEWSESDIEKAEREAVAKLEASAPKEYLEQAVAEARRPGELRESLEDSLSREPEDERAVLRTEANRWADFLERHHAGQDVEARAGEAVELAKEFEEAFAESPHSPELKQEMREKLFDAMERRARKLGDGELTVSTLDAAREWMLELVKSGRPEQYEETAPSEALTYVASRLEAWKNGLFKGKRKWLTAAVAALVVVAPPVGLFIASTALEAGILYEGVRALGESAPNLTKKGYGWAKERARERKLRRELRFA